ncbi:MAG: alpha/beta fold hydrolase [Nakamurella sp.]
MTSAADQLTETAAVRTDLRGVLGPIAALDTGAAPTGQGTVLLLPGYTGSKEDFVPILDPLCSNGFRAIAIDLPGQYESAGPNDEEAYSPLALGEVVAAVTANVAEQGRVVLLGHSFGGLVARGAVLAGAPVAGLVLLCSGPAAFHSGQRLESLRAGDPVLREHGKAVVYDGTVAVDRAERKTVSPAVAQFLRRRFLLSTTAGLLGMGGALQTEPDRVDQLRQALVVNGVPAAVLAGRGDDAWPLADQQEMANRLGTELVLIERAAHSPAVENPEGLLAVLLPLLHDWLDRR